MKPVIHDITYLGVANRVTVSFATSIPNRIERKYDLPALANYDILGEVAIDCKREFARIVFPVLQSKRADLSQGMDS